MAGVHSKDVLRKASSQLKQAKRIDKDELKDIMIRNDAIIASDKENNFERKQFRKKTISKENFPVSSNQLK